MEPRELIDTIRPVLEAGPPMRLCVLFGSAAKGAMRPDSDVDIGVIPVDPAIPLESELMLQSALERACNRKVDLVRLDRATALVRWEIARSGALVASSAPFEYPRFVARAALEHADLAPLLERTAERFRRRVAGTGR
jgi:predicted nucleotidyltransferase